MSSQNRGVSDEQLAENIKRKGFDKIVMVFSWLFEKESKISAGISDYIERNVWSDKQLKYSDRMLLHWLVYITDRGKNADVLWKINVPIIKNIIHGYNEVIKLNDQSIKSFNDFLQHLKRRMSTKGKKNKLAAFPNDVLAINKTLYLLFVLKKSFVTFLKDIQDDCRESENCLKATASALFILSYLNTSENDKNNWNEDIRRLREKDSLGYKNKMPDYHKRIWAALRDYIVRNDEENPLRQIQNDSLNKIKRELVIPGDLWNYEFFRNCLKQFYEPEIKNSDILKYITIEFEKREKNPIAYDVSFGFARKNCKGRMCNACIFADKSIIKDVCIGDLEKSSSKICPIGVQLYELYFYCEGANCKITQYFEELGPCHMPMVRDQ